MGLGKCGTWHKDSRDGLRYLIIGSGKCLHTNEQLTFYYGENEEVIGIPTTEFEEFFEV